MTNALLVVAHGSRRSESNDEVRTLTERVRDRAGDRYAAVECAFLELAPPDIAYGLAHLINRGATQITILPYFLAAGRHVTEDIPADVAPIRAAHPDVAIRIAPYVGTARTMPTLLLDMIGGTD